MKIVRTFVRHRELFRDSRECLITLSKKPSDIYLLHILAALNCTIITTRYGFRLHNTRSSESRLFYTDLYRALGVPLCMHRFSAVDCSHRQQVDIRVTTERRHCAFFSRLVTYRSLSTMTITRRGGSTVRAFFLGLLHNANLTKLRNVHIQGNLIIHPLLYIAQTRVISCLCRVNRSCIISDAGDRRVTVHGVIQKEIVPTYGYIAPRTRSGLLEAVDCVSTDIAFVGGTLSSIISALIRHYTSKQDVSVTSLVAAIDTRMIL